ncbi:hypothetical protein PDL71_15585 [Lacibacter sp. MH-610]|uniref:hypothetical protein n=1 Tax=Lacibacter sp. MH-610 TaxID=3020883 RepID=UPI00389144EA
MKVKDLKKMLEDADDEALVLIPSKNEFDGVFYSPCTEDSGIAEMGLYPDQEDEAEANLLDKKTTEVSFVLVPCGFFEEKDHMYEMN